jgi:stearoyl-CoA desaturase (delta-9 desaturase)
MTQTNPALPPSAQVGTDHDHQDDHDDIVYPSAIPFVILHVASFAAIWTGVTLEAALLCVALYWIRIFAIGAGYHRYFSHKSYSAGRVYQFLLACLAQSTAQKSVLWWAAKHRHHHLHSDTELDFHSPKQQGVFYAHVGWIFARQHDGFDDSRIQDLTRFPELRWLHRHERWPAYALAGLCYLLAGWPGLVVGFIWSTVLVYHGTFCINSLAHVSGRKRYVTGDDSRNNWLLAIITMGEGWHNNHHAYQSSVRQGFYWWEFDPTFYILKMLSWTGMIWDLRTPPEALMRNEQRLGKVVIDKAAKQLAASFNCESIAEAVATHLEYPSLSALQQRLLSARERATEVLATTHLPHMPTRAELRARARQMFARTPSLDDIVDLGHNFLLEAVSARLCASAKPG